MLAHSSFAWLFAPCAFQVYSYMEDFMLSGSVKFQGDLFIAHDENAPYPYGFKQVGFVMLIDGHVAVVQAHDFICTSCNLKFVPASFRVVRLLIHGCSDRNPTSPLPLALRREWDARYLAKRLRQATTEYAPPPYVTPGARNCPSPLISTLSRTRIASATRKACCSCDILSRSAGEPL